MMEPKRHSLSRGTHRVDRGGPERIATGQTHGRRETMRRGIALMLGVLLLLGLGPAAAGASVPRLVVVEFFGAVW